MIRNVRKRIRHPELIDGGHRHPRRQIQIHLAVMLRIRRQNVLAVANRQQVVFAHDPQDSFVIDDHPLPAGSRNGWRCLRTTSWMDDRIAISASSGATTSQCR